MKEVLIKIDGEDWKNALDKAFKKLNKEDIENYIDTQKPFDKAGSYGIQDKDFNFANKINGDIDNVIGFPIKLFEKLLKKITN